MVPNWNFVSFRGFVADEADAAVDADMLVLTVLLCAAAGVGGDEIINGGGEKWQSLSEQLSRPYGRIAVGDRGSLFLRS